MSPKHRLLAIVAAVALLAGVGLAPASIASAMPPQASDLVPPIIANTESGILRDLPTKYYQAVEDFENQAIADVLETHSLPDGDANAVRAWGRDAVRAQEFMNLLGIIAKPAAERTAGEALVHEWFQGVYQQQLVAQAQAALDQYLEWSGLTLETISLDPMPLLPDGGGYCDFHPPKALEEGTGEFGGVYDPSLLPQCQDSSGTTVACQLGPTGCPVPWPTVEQFEQWGRYLSQEDLWEDPVFPNLALESSVGVGLAAGMVATGATTAAARAYMAATESSTNLFAKVFPYAGRAGLKATTEGLKQVPKFATTAARTSAGVIRAGGVAFVVGTIITALITIALESYTIYEHQQIPITLKKSLADAKATPPDLAAVASKESGVGALMTTFLSTTQIDVDFDCQLENDWNPYSAFPCANAPDPAPPAEDDAAFWVSTEADGVTSGRFADMIYTVNPLDSQDSFTLNERSRASGEGWFVVTKYDGSLPENVDAPTTPGATLQTLRLYYRDWDGAGKVAERVVVDGAPMFAISSLDSADVGGCTTAPADGGTPLCLTDTLRYVQPDGAKVSARIVAAGAAGPKVSAVVPARVIAGELFALSATAEATFGTPPFTYRWVVAGSQRLGPAVSVSSQYAGNVAVYLEVADAQGNTTAQTYPVLAAQKTTVTVKTWPAGDVPYGGTRQVWAAISPLKAQGTQCTWNQQTGELGCTSPAGAVQFYVDGRPLGDPVQVTQNYLEPCFTGGGCPWTWGDNVAYAPAIALPTTGMATGSTHEVTAVYYGDEKFVGATSQTLDLAIVKATPVVTLTSGSTYPSPDTPVTLTAKVQAADGSRGVPTGTVQFLEGNSLAPLAPPVTVDSAGNATLTDVELKFVNSLAVRYLGDQNFAEAVSGVTPIRFPVATSATVDPASSTVLAGSQVDLSVTLLDELGDPFAGAPVTVSPGGHTVTTDAHGVASVSVTSDEIGEVTYTVDSGSATGLGSATVLYGSIPMVDDADAAAEVGVPFTRALSAEGVPAPTISVGTLPDGLSFDASTGEVTGTPTGAGTTESPMTATNALGSANATLSLTVHPAVAITTTALPGGTATLPYEALAEAGGGLAPFAWSADGLPDGLVLDASTGAITGSTTAEGATEVVLHVTDALGGTDSIALELVLAPKPRPDLEVGLSVGRLVTGQTARYAVAVENAGNAVAKAPVVVRTTLDRGLRFVGLASSGWSCTSARQVVTCTRQGDVAAGAVATLELDVRVITRPGSVTTDVTAVPVADEIDTVDNLTALTSEVVKRRG
ncbi:putative Ig domain-containing protein [Agromyces sp. NPDC055658]